MSEPRERPVRDWLLIAAMNLILNWFYVAIAVVAIGLSWYFDAWFLLGLAAFGVLSVAVEEHFDQTSQGMTIRPDDEPELAAIVDRAARAHQIELPLIVRVTPEPTAYLGWERVEGKAAYALHLGWPFISLMSADELASVISHELSHSVDLDTRLSRARVAARNGLAESWNIPVISDALLAATRTGSIESEFAADAAAARMVGAQTVASALVRTNAIERIFETLVEHWSEVMTDEGEYPADLFSCVRLALDDPDVSRWITMNDEQELFVDDPIDSHPPIPERIARLAASAVRTPGDPIRMRQASEIERWCLDAVYEPHESEFRAGSIRESKPGRFDFDPAEALDAVREATHERFVGKALLKVAELIEVDSWRPFARELNPDLENAPLEHRPSYEKSVVVNCVGTCLITPLVTNGWSRANPWLAQIVEDPAGLRYDIYQEVEDAIDHKDASRLRTLIRAAQLGGAA